MRGDATSAAPVAIVFVSSASATFPPDSRSAIIPEPTTAATRNAVPRNSAATRRDRLAVIVGQSGPLLFSDPRHQEMLEEVKETIRSCAPGSCTLLEMPARFP